MSAGLLMAVSGGCLAVKLALHLRTRLQDKPVTSIVASLPVRGLGPGQSTRPIIVATTRDGQELVTVGPGKGKVLFSSFTFTGTLVEVAKRGMISLPDDPRITEGKVPHLHIETIGHPGVVADLDVPVVYDVPFVADYSGSDGASGSAGASGASGADGANGSTDPKSPSPGGDGGDGGDGGNGGDGGDGGPGGHVKVWLTVRPGAHPMLEARVAGNVEAKLFLVDPNGGSLKIAANGGAGGAGGSAGSGGQGGNGGSGTPNGNKGRDGNSGASGSRGQPGAAGTIAVFADPAAQPYLSKLILSNTDGDGTPGPAPVIHTEPVPLLW